jgi:hypothetical protein
VIQSSTWSYVVAGSACTEDGEKSVHPCLPWPKVVTQRLTPTTSGKSKIASYQQLCIANLTSNRRGISDKQFAFEERGDAKIRCLSSMHFVGTTTGTESLVLTPSPLHRGSAPRPSPLPKGQCRAAQNRRRGEKQNKARKHDGRWPSAPCSPLRSFCSRAQQPPPHI